MLSEKQAKNPKNILVTGSSGFVGSHLLQYLFRRGHSVVGIARGKIKSVLDQPTISCDIRNQIQLEELKKGFDQFDIIIHCAAMVKRRYPDAPHKEYFKTNVIGTRNLANTFSNAKLIYISSCGVLEPDRHPYFMTKLQGEQTLEPSKNQKWLIARLTNVFGHGKHGGFLFVWKHQAELHHPLTVHTGQYRDLIGVKDVCRALELLGEKGEKKKTYTIGSNIPTKISDAAIVFKEAYADSVEINLVSTPYSKIIGDNTDVTLLGWRPTDSFPEFIQELIERWKTPTSEPPCFDGSEIYSEIDDENS